MEICIVVLVYWFFFRFLWIFSAIERSLLLFCFPSGGLAIWLLVSEIQSQQATKNVHLWFTFFNKLVSFVCLLSVTNWRCLCKRRQLQTTPISDACSSVAKTKCPRSYSRQRVNSSYKLIILICILRTNKTEYFEVHNVRDALACISTFVLQN